MGLILAAMFISGVSFVVFSILVLWLAAKFLRTTRARFLLCATAIGSAAIIAIAVLPTTASWLFGSTIRSGESVSPSEYRGLGPRLPEEATAITYESNYLCSDATFSITERDFLAWLEREKWTPHEIDPPTTDDLFLGGLDLPDIQNGIVVSETFHPRGTGVHIVFDRERQRCFYHYSSY